MTLLNSAVGEAIASKPRATPTAALRGNTNRGQKIIAEKKGTYLLSIIDIYQGVKKCEILSWYYNE
jgi:hypothetical protein